jgi:uncharacterized protein YidB (DUF937 family)
MTALLGLLAVAGYQHRDKIAEILGGIGQNRPGGTGQSGIGGFLGQLSESLGGASAGGVVSGGLGELVDRFKQSGHGETAESWVGTGPNKPVTPPQLEQAIGPEVLETLSKQTGLSREELLARLTRELPDAVDKIHATRPTPGGNGRSAFLRRRLSSPRGGDQDEIFSRENGFAKETGCGGQQ